MNGTSMGSVPVAETATGLSEILPTMAKEMATAERKQFATEDSAGMAEESLEPWVGQLDTAIRHIENLMLQMQLMEADRALFLTVEHFGWHRALCHLQQRLDHLHASQKEQRLHRLLCEAKADRSAGCLEPAVEKFEKALTLGISGHERQEVVEILSALQQELAERQSLQAVQNTDGDIWGVLGETRVHEKQVETDEIGALMTAGQWDEAAMQLEAAIDHWGLNAEFIDLYQQIVVGKTEAQEAAIVVGQTQIADLQLRATLAFESGDWLKARLLVAELLSLEPDHGGALHLVRQLDQV